MKEKEEWARLTRVQVEHRDLLQDLQVGEALARGGARAHGRLRQRQRRQVAGRAPPRPARAARRVRRAAPAATGIHMVWENGAQTPHGTIWRNNTTSASL